MELIDHVDDLRWKLRPAGHFLLLLGNRPAESELQFRLNRFWEARYIANGGSFIGLELLLINKEYLDESMLIPKNTSVLIHQVPGRPRVRLITTQEYVFTDLLIPSALFSYLAILLPRIENKVEHVQAETSNSHVALPPAAKYIEYEFGNDFYFIPAASIDTPALDWQRFNRQCQEDFGAGRDSFVYLTGMESKTPPPGYICHRCNVAGHCIHHCPTNGDSNYNVKRVKPPTGIPKYMLVALIHCQVVQLQLLNQKKNLDAFDKEIEGLPSTTRSVGEFTSRCCFQSFCVTS
ncbi:hypothetical protein HID58_057233, partial [Brassica napus]